MADNGRWVTVKGTHVWLGEGKSIHEALKGLKKVKKADVKKAGKIVKSNKNTSDEEYKTYLKNRFGNDDEEFVSVGYEGGKEQLRKDFEKSKKQQIMTEEEYLGSKGYSFMGYSETGLHNSSQHDSKSGRKQMVDHAQNKAIEYDQKRAEFRKEYQEKVASGEIRKPTALEQRLKIAQGMDGREDVEAARRNLTRMGIDWKTGEKIANNEKNINSTKAISDKVKQTREQRQKEIYKKKYGLDQTPQEFTDEAIANEKYIKDKYANAKDGKLNGRTYEQDYGKDVISDYDPKHANWRDRVKLNNERTNQKTRDLEAQRNKGKYFMNEDKWSDDYYGEFRKNEKANAKIKKELPNETYEYVDSYATYKEKLDKLDKDGQGRWTGKEYTNDEFMEHLTDANWHYERKMIEDAKLTNEQLTNLKNKVKLSTWSAELDKESTQRLIDEVKSSKTKTISNKVKSSTKTKYTDKYGKSWSMTSLKNFASKENITIEQAKKRLGI